MPKRIFYFSFFLLVVLHTVHADIPSTQGTRFWVTFMNNFNINIYDIDSEEAEKNKKKKFSTQLNISSQSSGVVKISNPSMSWDTSFTFLANKVTTVDIPPQYGYVFKENDSKQNRGLLVESTVPISLFALNYVKNSFDAAIVLPENILGEQYIVQVHEQVSQNYVKEFVIVATQDNTHVTYVSSISTDQPNPRSIELNQGNTYLISSHSVESLSGSSILADKPIAVFVGHRCAQMTSGNDYCDHLVEQLMPTNLWGRHFVVTKTQDQTTNIVVITALNDNTIVNIKGASTIKAITLNSHQSYYLDLVDSDNPFYIESSQPVECFLYLVSQYYKSNKIGDPSLVHISPIEQNIQHLSFVTTKTTEIRNNYISVVTTKLGYENMMLSYEGDTKNLINKSSFKLVANTNNEYYHATIELKQHGQYTLFTTKDGFTGYLYGLGTAESYAYNFGSAAYNLQAKIMVDGQLHEHDSCVEERCYQKPITFSPSSNITRTSHDTIVWDFGDNTQSEEGDTIVHRYGDVGTYKVRMIIKNNRDQDTAYTTLCLKENIYDTVFESICANEQFLFRGKLYSENGFYDDTIKTDEWCDSIVTLSLTKLNSFYDSLNISICHGETYTFNGKEYSTSCREVFESTLPNGCDSIMIFTLNVGQAPLRLDTNAFFPSGNTFQWHTGKYSADGDYYDTIRTRSGILCDSIIYHLHLESVDHPLDVEKDTTCEQQITFNNQTFTIPDLIAGYESNDSLYNTYVIEYRDDALCTSYFKYIAIPKIINHTFRDTVTVGTSYEYYGEIFVATGLDTLIKRVQHGYNCPNAYDTMFLVGVNFPFIKTTETLCKKVDTIFWRDRKITTAGIYADTVKTIAGIDSVFRLTVIDKRSSSNTYINATGSYTWPINGVAYTKSGTYEHIIPNKNGCDSIMTLYLGIDEKCVIRTEEHRKICEGSSIEWNGQECNEEKEYQSDTLESVTGCDSIAILHLSFGKPATTDLGEISICRNTVFIYDNDTLTQSCEKEYHYLTSAGCDSTVKFKLNVKENSYVEATGYIRTGRIYSWEGLSINSPGKYSVYYEACNKCDSIISIDLQASTARRDTTKDTICWGEEKIWRNEKYNHSGNYVDSSIYWELPYDSFYYLNLSVGQSYTQERFFSINSNNDRVIFSPGNLQYNASLDSHLVASGVFQRGSWRFAENQWDYVGDDNVGTVFYKGEKCNNELRSDSYTGWIDLYGWGTSGWNDRHPYLSTSNPDDYGIGDPTINGTNYDWGFFNQIEFDNHGFWRTLSIEEWDYILEGRPNASSLRGKATIVVSESNEVRGLILLPDNWKLPDGISFSNSENYDVNSYNIEQWEIMETAGAVFLPGAGIIEADNHYQDDAVSGLDGFYWSSSFNQTADGPYGIRFYNLYNAVVHENKKYEAISVRLVHPVQVYTYDTICQGDTTFWSVDKKKYFEEGVFHDTLTTSLGCDSVVGLHLTVHPAFKTDLDTAICQGQKLLWQGKEYDSKGFYADSLSTIYGCDSLFYLHLTINPTYDSVDYQNLCQGDSFYWEINGRWYKSTNIYEESRQTICGCDSDFSLNLNVLPTYNISLEDILCAGDTLTWNGEKLFDKGIYEDTLLSSLGCDSVVVLHLTVHPAFKTDLDTAICQGQKLLWQGKEYDSKGFYADSLSTIYGCDSLFYLYLTINPTYDSVDYQNLCQGDSFYWEINGRWYKSTNIYEESRQTICGCDSIFTLALNVYPTYSISVEDSLCAGDTLTWNGEKLFKTGSYTKDLKSATSCDSSVTLHLTLLPSFDTVIYDTILLGERYKFNNETYEQTGTYENKLVTSSGCDSTIVLKLHAVNLLWEVIANNQCADDPYVNFEIEVKGDPIPQFQLEFSDKARSQHFRDTLIDNIQSRNLIQIPNHAKAGIYRYTITPLGIYGHNHARQDSFVLLYPTSVLDQHWNDFIAVLSKTYNGGYDFVSFQWYKNGKPVAGETNSYFYQPLEMGNSYSALLEEANGTKLMTCDLIAEYKTEISLYPTALYPGQLVNLYLSELVLLEIYTIDGKRVYSNTFQKGNNTFPAPYELGVYIVKIHTRNGEQQIKKIIVL